MKFCLLTRFHCKDHETNFQTRLLEEARVRGHEFILVHPDDVSLQFKDGEFPVYWKGEDFPAFDLIHYALRWDDDYTWEVVESLDAWHRPLLRTPKVPMGDKVTMARLFARENLVMPNSWLVNSMNQLLLALNSVQFPCVMKVRRKGGGREVHIVREIATGELKGAELLNEGNTFLLQQIDEGVEEEVHAFIVGSEVVSAMKRTVTGSDVYTKPVVMEDLKSTQLTKTEQTLVQAAARIYGAPYAEVHFLRTQKGASLLELNKVPAFERMEQVTGVNLAKKVVQYCENLVDVLIDNPHF